MAFLYHRPAKATVGQLCVKGGGQIDEMRVYIHVHESKEVMILGRSRAAISMFYVIIVHHYFSKNKNRFLHIMSTTTTPPIELLERD